MRIRDGPAAVTKQSSSKAFLQPLIAPVIEKALPGLSLGVRRPTNAWYGVFSREENFVIGLFSDRFACLVVVRMLRLPLLWN